MAQFRRKRRTFEVMRRIVELKEALDPENAPGFRAALANVMASSEVEGDHE